MLDAGSSPPRGVVVKYYLGSELAATLNGGDAGSQDHRADISLAFRDDTGRLVAEFRRRGLEAFGTGLRDNAFPSCPECADDPAYLAKNSGIAPAFSGPSGADAQYGQISYMGITTNADVAAAQQFLEFWFSDGYLDWLSVSVEGKFPMRRGTQANPTAFIDGWKELETGVDRKATLIEGASSFDRWGFAQGQGPLVTAVYEALPVPRLLRDVLDGTLSPAAAAAEIQIEVEDLKAGLEG